MKATQIMNETNRGEVANHRVQRAVVMADTEDQDEVTKARKLPKQAQGDPDRFRGGDHIQDLAETAITLSIRGDHVQDHIRDPKDRVRSLNHDISLRVVRGQSPDRDLDRDGLDLEVPIEDVRALDVDPARAVESRITAADQDPLVAGGVRGHTDIESPGNFRLYFFTDYNDNFAKCVLYNGVFGD